MEWYIEPKDIQCNEYFTQTGVLSKGAY